MPNASRVLAAVAVCSVGLTGPLRAQTPGTPVSRSASVEVLVSQAMDASPTIHAAAARVEAARAGVGPAGALPDPMLMAGLMNQSISGAGPDGVDAMAMKTIGVSQTLPFPGKLALERRAAEAEVAAAEANLEAARWSVRDEVESAYYDLAFLDRSLEILRRNEALLSNFVRVTQSRYGVGTGSQADVLKARVEASRLAAEAVALTERRRATLARLNSALNRPTDTPVDSAAIPQRIARAAVPDEANEIRFTSAVLGARAAGSPLPPLEELQERAVGQNPSIRAHEARIAAQTARVELARKAYLPDFDLSLQYGQRTGMSDVVSAVVSVPIPIHKGQKQDLAVKEAEAQLAALQAEHHQHANEIRAEVAGAYADLERERAQLALFVKSILPQGRAALASATASFQVGRVDFLTLLENQTTLYDYETAYYRSLDAFADRLADLDRVVGEEVIR